MNSAHPALTVAVLRAAPLKEELKSAFELLPKR